jgi:hypothetical protein
MIQMPSDPDFSAALLALDQAPQPVDFFLRDDDAGWDDAALHRLLDVTVAAGVPIDLAVIPQSVTPRLACELMHRQDEAPGLIGLHQHGFAHLNHEVNGRRCEFGDARAPALQRADLSTGRDILLSLFGDRLDPIFTPPWNRCSVGTPTLLADLGFCAMSRSRSAAPQSALPELPVDVDWCKHEREAADQAHDDAATRIAQALAQRVRAGGPVGLMLHHAAMDARSLDRLAALLPALKAHPRLRCRRMRDLLGLGSDARASARLSVSG